MLSISCLYFLKEASKSEEMSKCMEDDEFSKYFFENLLSEQNLTFKEHENIPIELEYTTLGCNMYNLRETLFGTKSLDPWNKVSFRIIQQIANVLQCLDPLTVNELKLEQGEKKTEAMERNLKKGFVKRIYSELDLWYEKREVMYHEKTTTDKLFFENVRQQHRYFAHNSGLYLLITFLTKKIVRSGYASRVNVSYSIYDDEDGLNNSLLKEELYAELEIKAEEFKNEVNTLLENREKQLKLAKLKRNKGVKEPAEEKKLKDAQKVVNMRRALQKAPMPSLEPRKNIEDPSLIYGRAGEQAVEEEVEGKELKTEINSMIAPATVAAFLRVIYAAIKFAPDKECIKISLAHITEIEIFKKITTLCYKAGWTVGSIGLKYLRIVRNVIEYDEIVEELQEETKQETKQKSSKKKDKLQSLKYIKDKLYFYEIISRAIKQILSNVVNNFAKKKEKSLFSCEEEIFIISEITKICKLTIEKISLIKFINTEKEDLKANEKQIESDKLLDWIIGKLVDRQVITTLLKLKSIDISKDNFDEHEKHEEEMAFREFDKKKKKPKINYKPHEEEEKSPDGGYTAFATQTPGDSGATNHKAASKPRDNKSRTILRELDIFKDNLKILLGEYLSKCKGSQYEIVETVMKMEVFEGKKNEHVFLVNALNYKIEVKSSVYLENYMKKRGMMLSDGELGQTASNVTAGGTDTGTPDTTKPQKAETIKLMEICSISVAGAPPSENRIFCLSNYGVYVLVSSSKSNRVIGKGNEPTLEYSWEYKQIEHFKIEKTKDRKKRLIIEIPQMKGFFTRLFGFMSSNSTPNEGTTNQGFDQKRDEISFVFKKDSGNSDITYEKALNIIKKYK